jgi:D-apionolactonase
MSETSPVPKRLTVGSLSAVVDPNGSFARAIRIGEEEIFRGIGFVVRDANWGTPALTASAQFDIQTDRATVASAGRVTLSGETLDWSVQWTIAQAGLEAHARFSSQTGFSTNRTGFVVLHSLGASRGRPLVVTHPDGRSEEAVFPDLVSPHQPFFDIAALAYDTQAGHRISLAFEGEVFETEDQRNWTDASYKTYCRPLRLPFPYRIEAGTTVEQVVRLGVSMAKSVRPAPAPTPVATASMPLPLLGTSIPPGPAMEGTHEAIMALDLGFTAIELDPSDPGAIDEARVKIGMTPGPIRFDLRGASFDETRATIRGLAPLTRGRTVLGLSVWDSEADLVTEAQTLLPGVEIGAGTGAFFTELNRMKAFPEAADYATWTSNPTVHGHDDDTIGETTEPLSDILRSAKAKVPARRFHIGPMTLGLRFNPNATTAEGRRRSADPDPRQATLIAAAWLGATFIGFLDPEVESLTFFEPIGPKGLIGAGGRPTPSAHLATRLAALAGHGATVLRWPTTPRAAGLLVDAPAGAVLCVAHAQDGDARLSLPPGRWGSHEMLTADGLVEAGRAADGFLEMRGFSVAWLKAAH